MYIYLYVSVIQLLQAWESLKKKLTCRKKSNENNNKVYCRDHKNYFLLSSSRCNNYKFISLFCWSRENNSRCPWRIFHVLCDPSNFLSRIYTHINARDHYLFSNVRPTRERNLYQSHKYTVHKNESFVLTIWIFSKFMRE